MDINDRGASLSPHAQGGSKEAWDALQSHPTFHAEVVMVASMKILSWSKPFPAHSAAWERLVSV